MSKAIYLGALLVLGAASVSVAQHEKTAAPAKPATTQAAKPASSTAKPASSTAKPATGTAAQSKPATAQAMQAKPGEPIPSIVKKNPAEADKPVVQAPTSNAKLVVPETDFRFGYAPQNAHIAHNYWLKNDGPDSLHLVDVRPGCGCTKAPLKKHALAAGDSTDVEVIFSTGMYSSKTQKSATIISDVSMTVPNLTFSAWPMKNVDSLTPFVVSPPLVDLDSLKDQGKMGSVDVHVKNTSTTPFSLKLVSAPSTWFTINVPSGSIAPGASESIRVSFSNDIADTTLQKSFTIEASDSALTRYTVPIQKAMRWGPTTSSATH